MNTDRLVRRAFFGLTTLFVLFIAYASWTPGSRGFEATPRPFAGLTSVSRVLAFHDLRDVATNVLLYIPLGIFLALALTTRRPRFISLWVVVGFAVSAVMEAGQSFIGRYPDVVDIATNTLGFLVGYWVIVAGARFYGLDAAIILGLDPSPRAPALLPDSTVRAAPHPPAAAQTVAALRFVYASLYVLVALLPFDVSVSLSKIYAQLVPDAGGNARLILDPFYHIQHWQQYGLKLTLELLALLPMSILTVFLDGARGRVRLLSAVSACVALAGACESAQVFILSRTSDASALLLSLGAGVLGWAMVKAWLGLQGAQTASPAAASPSGFTCSVSPGGTFRQTVADGRWRAPALALLGYALIVAFFAWSPFEFETDLRRVAAKILHESNMVPFREHFETRNLSSAIDIAKEAGLFVPFGLLSAYLIGVVAPRLERRTMLASVALVSGAFATFTELSQSVCIGRYIDATDILLAVFGAVWGAVLLGIFRLRPPATHAPTDRR